MPMPLGFWIFGIVGEENRLAFVFSEDYVSLSRPSGNGVVDGGEGGCQSHHNRFRLPHCQVVGEHRLG